jgi:hypothetical protein
MTWRQKAGGSPSVDVANGPGIEAFALRRKVRRRGNGACSALAPRRIEDEGFASRATSGSGRIEVRLEPRLQRDRGGEFASRQGPAAEGSELASVRGCERVETGSLLLIEGPASGRIGVRFDLRFAKRVRHDREVRLSTAACPCGKAVLGLPGSADCEGTRSREAQSFRAGPGGEERTFASASNRPRGKTEGPGLSADPGDGETGCFGAPPASLFEAARGESCCDASETGNGHPGLGLARTRREPPRPHGLDGTHGDHRRLRPPHGVRPPSG